MTDLRNAAQQALEALEESEQHYGSDSALRDAIQTLRAALAQPEQEPVVWRYRFADDSAGWILAEHDPRTAHSNIVAEPLYTRREWRGLTDTERAAVQFESFKRGLSPLEFMELHEAKLKEKNHE